MNLFAHFFWLALSYLVMWLNILADRVYERSWWMEKKLHRKARLALGDDSYECEDCDRFVADTEVCMYCLAEVCRLCMRDNGHRVDLEETDESDDGSERVRDVVGEGGVSAEHDRSVAAPSSRCRGESRKCG